MGTEVRIQAFGYQSSNGTTYFLHGSSSELLHGVRGWHYWFEAEINPECAVAAMPPGKFVSENFKSRVPYLTGTEPGTQLDVIGTELKEALSEVKEVKTEAEQVAKVAKVKASRAARLLNDARKNMVSPDEWEPFLQRNRIDPDQAVMLLRFEAKTGGSLSGSFSQLLLWGEPAKEEPKKPPTPPAPWAPLDRARDALASKPIKSLSPFERSQLKKKLEPFVTLYQSLQK